MPYNGEIIHFMGGIHDYIGELSQTKPHPMGPHWYRINKPCITFLQQGPQKLVDVVASMHGPFNKYRKFVDIYIPPDSTMEIRVLDKKGKLFKFYQEELSRKGPDLIKVADSSIVSSLQ